MSLSELDRASRSWVKLDEEESVKDIRVARARLKDSTPAGQSDALFVFHENSLYCGSGGCLLQVLMDKGGEMRLVFEVQANEVSVGKISNKGVRNLRFDDAVTWKWTGRTYDIQ